jgi:hypothetical protein
VFSAGAASLGTGALGHHGRTRDAGRDAEVDPRPGLALDVELAAVALHDVLDDREARGRAAGLARAAAVDA